MGKHELRVASYDCCEFTSCQFTSASSNLPVTSPNPQVQIHELRVQLCELGVQIHKLRV